MRRFLLILMLIISFKATGQIENYIWTLSNPAMTGVDKEVFFIHRSALSRFPLSYSLNSGGLSYLFDTKKVGAGGSFRYEQEGYQADLRLESDYSYSIRFSEKILLNFGLAPTFNYHVIDLNALHPKDQGDAVLNNLPDNSSIFDMNVGVYFYCKPIYASISIFDLTNHKLVLNDYFYNITYHRTFKGRVGLILNRGTISFSPCFIGHFTSVSNYSMGAFLKLDAFEEKISVSIGSSFHDTKVFSKMLYYGTIGYRAGKIGCFIYYGTDPADLYQYTQGDLGIGLKYYFTNPRKNIQQ